jgi:fatty-acyl-CoA synthase
VNQLNQWREATVGSLLIGSTQRAPDRPALQWMANGRLKSLAWAELLIAATEGAQRLRSCAASDRAVAIWGPNSAGCYISLWAAALSGRPLAPVNPALTPSEARALIQDSGASTVLAAACYRDRSLLSEASAMTASLPAVTETWDVDSWWSATPATSTPASEDSAAPGDTFLIQYTSGTTGAPKGAMLSHRACVNGASTMIAGLEPTEHEVFCSPMPLHHIGASIAHALALACVAGTWVMLSDFDAATMVEAAALSGATLLGGVPIVYQRILDDPAMADVRLSSVRVMMLGGASIPPSLVSRMEKHFGARVVVLYGQSEAPAISQTRLDDPDWVKATTVGRALPHREVRVVDPATGATAESGVVGEICVRTRVSMDGYLHRPEATAATIDDQDWLHTGDLGSMGDDGLLFFHGRIREVILRGGENVYAREVENVIGAHPDVSQVAVVGMPDPRWGEIVVAVVVPRPLACLSEADLEGTVSTELAYFKRPAQWHIIDTMPMTASGKPQKFKIVDMLTAGDGC